MTLYIIRLNALRHIQQHFKSSQTCQSCLLRHPNVSRLKSKSSCVNIHEDKLHQAIILEYIKVLFNIFEFLPLLHIFRHFYVFFLHFFHYHYLFLCVQAFLKSTQGQSFSFSNSSVISTFVSVPCSSRALPFLTFSFCFAFHFQKIFARL